MRRRWLVAALGVPVLCGALWMGAIEIYRWRCPHAWLFMPAAYATFADAIAADDQLGMYAFVRRGTDPSALIEVRDSSLTGNRAVFVSPIAWAVAHQSPRAVLMLLGQGARLERPADRQAACLADRLGNGDIAASLRRFGRLPDRDACPAQWPTGPPLLALADGAVAPAP